MTEIKGSTFTEVVTGPYKAIQHESGWWVIVGSGNVEIDNSGDGGFDQANAEHLVRLLNKGMEND